MGNFAVNLILLQLCSFFFKLIHILMRASLPFVTPKELQKVHSISHHMLHTCPMGPYFCVPFKANIQQWTELKTRLMLCYLQFCWTRIGKLSHLGILKFIQDPKGRCPLGPYTDLRPREPNGLQYIQLHAVTSKSNSSANTKHVPCFVSSVSVKRRYGIVSRIYLNC